MRGLASGGRGGNGSVSFAPHPPLPSPLWSIIYLLATVVRRKRFYEKAGGRRIAVVDWAV